MDKLKFLSKYQHGNLRNRQLNQQLEIVRYLAKSEEGRSIPEIAKYIQSSVPTVTKLIKELFENNYLIDEGKRETDNGRRPTLYSINPDQFYVVGVEILSKFIHVSIVKIDFTVVHQEFNRNFILEDTEDCLNLISDFIKNTITKSNIQNHQIIGVGIGMTGSINPLAGISNQYFKNRPISFQNHLEKYLDLPVRLDNDTRAIGIAEQVLGHAKGIDNALVVKVSRNLGLSIILNKSVILGSKGLAGNFRHTQFVHGNRLCKCGKKGCLGTEVSGNALQQDLAEALSQNKQSIYFNLDKSETYQYHDILDAVLKGDALSIELLQKQGDKLGQALGNLVNLLNPRLIVISGEFVMVKDFFIDTIKMGMRKTALVETLQNCQIEPSHLGRYLSSKAGACMLLKNCDLITY